MLAKVFSAAVLGLDAYIVEVEAHLEAGIPSFSLVGLPDAAIKESRDRVNAALKNSFLQFPLKKITINLAPADIKKEGSAYDLPIAIAILAACGEVDADRAATYLILGELALDGSLRPIKGSLPVALSAKEKGYRGVIIPAENGFESALVEEIETIPVHNLSEVIAFLNGDKEIAPQVVDVNGLFADHAVSEVDFSEVKGQFHVKRSLEIAAAGSHNLLMIGPPGSGKSMLARRFSTILPDMTMDESLETTKIYSVAGLLPTHTALIAQRPYRSPHHSISDAALVGGGQIPRPGEISLSHNGVLFLDELPEFKKNVLEVMRQPLEDREVTIARAASTLKFPANFLLIAAMNPCPCGYFGDKNRECTCQPQKIKSYVSKISGPLLDRIDIHIEVPAVKYDELTNKSDGESSHNIRQRVIKARLLQLERYKGRTIYANSAMTGKDIKKHCNLDDASHAVLKQAIDALSLSARAYNRILKVARTIADLEDSKEIKINHLTEAIQYRSLDRKYL